MTTSAPLRLRLLVPDELGVLAEHVLGGVIRVVIAVRSGKDDDGEFHGQCQLPGPSFRRSGAQSSAGGSRCATGECYSTSTR